MAKKQRLQQGADASKVFFQTTNSNPLLASALRPRCGLLEMSSKQ